VVAFEFLTISEVAEVLRAQRSLVMGLIDRGELRAFQVGARGQWRVSARDLEDYVDAQYAKGLERLRTTDIEKNPR